MDKDKIIEYLLDENKYYKHKYKQMEARVEELEQKLETIRSVVNE
jgi:prefoldin subunit 5